MNKNVLIVTAVICMLYREVKLECSPKNLPQEVQSCPTLEKEVKEAAKRLKCKEKCCRMEYHCLPYTNMDGYVELCAHEVFIIGKRCAEYNKVGDVVQANRYNHLAYCGNHSNPCPDVYSSTELFKYPQCFNQPSKTNSVVEITTTSRSSTEKRTQSSNDVEITVISISISMFGIAVILIVLLKACILRRRKPRTEEMGTDLEETLMPQRKILIQS